MTDEDRDRMAEFLRKEAQDELDRQALFLSDPIAYEEWKAAIIDQIDEDTIRLYSAMTRGPAAHAAGAPSVTVPERRPLPWQHLYQRRKRT